MNHRMASILGVLGVAGHRRLSHTSLPISMGSRYLFHIAFSMVGRSSVLCILLEKVPKKVGTWAGSSHMQTSAKRMWILMSEYGRYENHIHALGSTISNIQVQ